MTIQEAIEALKRGQLVRRVSWIDKTTFWRYNFVTGAVYNQDGICVYKNVEEVSDSYNDAITDFVIIN